MEHPPLDVAPGIRCIPVRSPTLPPATHTNVWVLGERRLTVIDPASPWTDEQARLWETLSGLGVVERILNEETVVCVAPVLGAVRRVHLTPGRPSVRREAEQVLNTLNT